MGDGIFAGDELSRPRVMYFFYYPLILGSAALLAWIFPTDRMTGISSAIATVVSCLMMWDFLFTGQVIRFSTICAMGLTIGYGAGTLNSWLTIPRGNFPLASVIGQTVPELANGVAAALMACAVLMVLGEFLEKPIWTMASRLELTEGVKRVLLANSGILAIAAGVGMFHQGGLKTSGAHHAGFVAEMVGFLVQPSVIVATIAFLVERDKVKRYLFGAIMAFLWLVTLTQGRMTLVYPALVTVGLARYAGYRWDRISWKKVLVLAAGLFFLIFGVLTYQLLRIAGGRVSSQNIGAEVNQAQRWAAKGEAWRIATSSTVENVQGRTLIVSFLSDLLYQTQTHTPALGKDLLLQIEIDIPSVIYRNKPTIAEENIASRTFGLFYTDQPNSVFTAGALDFGFWGMLIYPIAIMLFFSLVLRLGATYLPFELFLYGLVAFVVRTMGPELQITAYFETIRNFIVFSVLIYAVLRLPQFRRSAVDQ